MMCFEIKKFFFSAIEGLYQHALWKRCGSLTQIVCLLQKKFLFVFLTSFSNSQRNLIFSLQPEKLNFYSPPPNKCYCPYCFYSWYCLSLWLCFCFNLWCCFWKQTLLLFQPLLFTFWWSRSSTMSNVSALLSKQNDKISTKLSIWHKFYVENCWRKRKRKNPKSNHWRSTRFPWKSYIYWITFKS